MILLWGLPTDEPLDRVGAALAERNCRFALIDQRASLEQRVELDDGTRLGGTVISGDATIALDDVSAFYNRVYDVQQLRHIVMAGDEAQRRVQKLHNALWAWADRPMPAC